MLVCGVTIPGSLWFALLGISCSAEKVNGYTCDGEPLPELTPLPFGEKSQVCATLEC